MYYDALEDPSDPPPAPSEPPSSPCMARPRQFKPASCKPALIALDHTDCKCPLLPSAMLPGTWVCGWCILHGQGYVQGLPQYCRKAVMGITQLGDKARPRGSAQHRSETLQRAWHAGSKLPAMHLAGPPLRPGRQARQLRSIATHHTMQVPFGSHPLAMTVTLESLLVSLTSQVLDISSISCSICKHSTSEAATGLHLEQCRSSQSSGTHLTCLLYARWGFLWGAVQQCCAHSARLIAHQSLLACRGGAGHAWTDCSQACQA